MKLINLNREWAILCETKNTRNGFKHVAVLLKNGREFDKVKICYLNRTWESYEYESVIKSLKSRNKDELLSLEVSENI